MKVTPICKGRRRIGIAIFSSKEELPEAFGLALKQVHGKCADWTLLPPGRKEKKVDFVIGVTTPKERDCVFHGAKFHTRERCSYIGLEVWLRKWPVGQAMRSAGLKILRELRP